MKDRLLKLLKKEAFFKKKVKLSSGKVSSYYIDVRRVSLKPEGLYLISYILWRMLKNDNFTAFGGPTLGADPIVGGVCMRACKAGKDIKGFLIRKTPKKHGRQRLIEGCILSSEDKAILVDDVVTTGSSLVKSIKVLKKQRIKIVKAMVVVDRGEGAGSNLAVLGCPLVSIFSKEDF